VGTVTSGEKQEKSHRKETFGERWNLMNYRMLGREETKKVSHAKTQKKNASPCKGGHLKVAHGTQPPRKRRETVRRLCTSGTAKYWYEKSGCAKAGLKSFGRGVKKTGTPQELHRVSTDSKVTSNREISNGRTKHGRATKMRASTREN